MLEPRHTLFTYLHLAPDPELTRGLVESGATCVAYETVEDARGRLPLLAPMSEVAGKIATQAGAFMLEKPLGGRGILLGGVPGVAAAKVMIIGGGVVGMNAAFIALGMEATVYVYDRNIDRLRELDIAFGGRADTCYASTLDIEQRLPEVDLVIGAVLVHGAKAPYVIRREQLGADEAPGRARRRLDRSGRLLRDLAADDALRPDLRGRRRPALLRGQHAGRGAGHLDARADQRDDAVRRCTSPTRASRGAARENPGLAKGVNVVDGKVTYQPVAEATGQPYTELFEALGARSLVRRASSSAAGTTAWWRRRISRGRGGRCWCWSGATTSAAPPSPSARGRASTRGSRATPTSSRCCRSALREELGLTIELRRRSVSSYSPRPDGTGLLVRTGEPPHAELGGVRGDDRAGGARPCSRR